MNMSDHPESGKSMGDLAQEILDRLVADQDFRSQLLENPAETLAQAGYMAGDDVSGYGRALGGIVMGAGGPGSVAKQIDTLPNGCDPTTTAINCGGGGGGGGQTTAINCGGGAPTLPPAPKPNPTPTTT
jgi:hypothetical protein